MEKELFLSGYCRCMDASRMVEVVVTDRDVEIDCSYENCPHTLVCEIAKKIAEIKKEMP